MTTSKNRVQLRRGCSACAGAALLLGAVGVYAATPDELTVITVSAPQTKIVAHGPGPNTATQQVTVSARVQYDPVTLTTNSGVALLKDGVEQAAQRICRAADPQAPLDNNCVRNAIDGAQPQIEAAVKRARALPNG